jgi:hypothetical protein
MRVRQRFAPNKFALNSAVISLTQVKVSTSLPNMVAATENYGSTALPCPHP